MSSANAKPRIFIDGHAGTTGLRIRQWLEPRTGDSGDLGLVTLPDAERKSEAARRKAIAESDLTVLCLPDEAAVQAAEWAKASDSRILDASSAQRVAEGWVYGLPEMAPGQREAIREARQVTNPGCYPTAFVLLVRPLVDAGLLPADAGVSIHALSGYSGGGKSMIEKWESAASGLVGLPFEAPYAVEKVHKHIPEMHRYSNLEHAPQFLPAVGPFACGMRVEVPLHQAVLSQKAKETPGKAPGEIVWQALADRYANEAFVEVASFGGFEPLEEKSLDPTRMNDSNGIRLSVHPHPDGHLLLVGLLDNLGKGAAGAAIQNLNLMLGLGEEAGLPRS